MEGGASGEGLIRSESYEVISSVEQRKSFRWGVGCWWIRMGINCSGDFEYWCAGKYDFKGDDLGRIEGAGRLLERQLTVLLWK